MKFPVRVEVRILRVIPAWVRHGGRSLVQGGQKFFEDASAGALFAGCERFRQVQGNGGSWTVPPDTAPLIPRRRRYRCPPRNVTYRAWPGRTGSSI
jgi:hypothetical protein